MPLPGMCKPGPGVFKPFDLAGVVPVLAAVKLRFTWSVLVKHTLVEHTRRRRTPRISSSLS